MKRELFNNLDIHKEIYTLQKTRRFAIALSMPSTGLLTSCGANYASNPFVGENGTVYMGEGSYSAAGYRLMRTAKENSRVPFMAEAPIQRNSPIRLSKEKAIRIRME